MSDIKVTWEIDDGYAGKSRPQVFYIPRDDWDACETQQQKDELVEAMTDFEFYNNISFYVKRVEE